MLLTFSCVRVSRMTQVEIMEDLYWPSAGISPRSTPLHHLANDTINILFYRIDSNTVNTLDLVLETPIYIFL